MSHSIVLPRQPGPATHLFLLFHGVGATAASLLPLGQRLGAEFPGAAVVCVAAPFAADFGGGAQWFSVSGITEADRPARVEHAMPAFRETIQHWQREFDVPSRATTLIGFSQGAIMALASTAASLPAAGRVVSLSGRFAALPAQVSGNTTIHLIHGQKDGVIPAGFAIAAAERLKQLGADVTLDLHAQVAHEINDAVVTTLLQRLRELPSDRSIAFATSARQIFAD